MAVRKNCVLRGRHRAQRGEGASSALTQSHPRALCAGNCLNEGLDWRSSRAHIRPHQIRDFIFSTPNGSLFPGGMQALNRRELWATRRVFFLTPQIMVNDLSRGTCPAVEIKCLVIDEAHKALGNHAYCQVVKELSRYTKQFRVLALTATPGSDTKAVQQVVSNLLIAQIEQCTEDSPEILPYSHERQVEKIVVPLGEELGGIQRAYIHVLETFAGRLIKMGVLARRDIPSLTKYQIILARDQYRKNPSPQNVGMQQGVIEGDFALCISLYHGYELLQQMGARSLFIYLCGIMDGSKGLTRTKNELGRNEDFMRLYQQLTDMFSDVCQTSANGNLHKSRTVSENKKEFIYSHPKLKKLEEIVTEHFKSRGCSDQTTSGSTSVDTRVMIFSSFRDSVQEIAEMLSRFSPVVRVMTFVGHSTGKSTKGFTQKEQLEVVKRFREGGYNTLVSTCVGEEGLDIGEVDLIICFDAQKSPIRLVQRMGRTGRQRRGRVVVILTEGREERTYNQSHSNKRNIQKAISGNKMLHFYQHSPRMIPEGINPELHRMFITAEKYEPNDSRKLSRGRPSSLHHKSALFSCVTDPKEMHCQENWSLSPEEFEIWDRLYRLKENDGVKQPILPHTRFETLENLDETSKPEEEAVHKLSLSEWSIWQNRPFPTSMVDHSDRCHHFISVMEMIEVMRQEQGDCSYDLELQPHLRIEDVRVQRNKSRLSSTSSTFAQKTRSSKRDMAHAKKMFVPDISDNEREFFSIFKTTNTKTSRRTPGLDLEEPELPTDTDASEPCSAKRLTLVESAEQGSQKEEEVEKVTFDLNEFNDLCDDSESTVTHESAAVKDLRSLAKHCSSVGLNHTDLSYSSFTAEKSVSSDLFYLPESHVDSLVLVSSSVELSRPEEAFSCVKRLLAHSPPPVSKLEDFEKLLRQEEALCPLPKVSCRSYSGQLLDKDFSLEVSHSLLPAESPELEVTVDLSASVNTCISKPASSPPPAAGGAQERPPWGGSFHSLLGKEGFTANHTNNPSNKHFVQGDGDLETNKKNVTTDKEKSIHLFEDEHIYETNDETTPVNAEPLLRSGSGRQTAWPTAGPGSRLLPSGPGCPHGDTACSEGAARGEMAPRGAGGHGSATEQALHTSDLCDYSQELFSVNFDLGFSIEECEKEMFEEDVDAINTSKLNSASGSGADVQLTACKKSLNNGCRIQTSPKWDCKDLEGRNISTPLPLQSRNVRDTAVPGGMPGGRTRRGASPPSPSTPTGRKVRSAEATKRIRKNMFSTVREESPEVHPTDKVNANSQRRSIRSSALDVLDSTGGRTENLEGTNLHTSRVFPAEGTSSESEEEIVFQRKNRRKNVLKSPDVVNDSDFESPVRAVRKRRHPLSVSDLSSDDSVDFHKNPNRSSEGCSAVGTKAQLKGVKRQKVRSNVTRKDAARQFLDEEAELSQQDESCVSSDETEDTDKELSSSLAQFLNDDAEVTQVLNDSEMRGVYLKSVRSPALGNRYKMVHREFNSTEIFSQIPEQDETYAEDSFCVAEGDEETCKKNGSSEEEEVCVNFDLLNNESFGGGRQRYLTRRRKKLHRAKMEQNCSVPGQKKPSRIIVLSDSSGEETSVSNEKGMASHCSRAEQGNAELLTTLPSVSSVPHKKTAGDISTRQSADSKSGMLLGLKASVSEMLDFHPGPRSSSGKEALLAPAEHLQLGSSVKNTAGNASGPTKVSPALPDRDTALCVLVDSREISSGTDVISSLKAVHGVKVQVCSLGSSDYVVSNRMAVERKLQSELLSSVNRSKVTQRIQRLQSMFERVCVIVEKDRTKPGETSRFFQRTQHYDVTLAALLQAGIRVLFSSCQEETAVLLKELALLEQRKNAAIRVPTEVQGHKQEMLNFYLSIPNISYLAALNMCHHFSSVRTMVNSSPSDIAAGAQVSLQRAEETFRYLRYGFDTQMLPESLCAKGKSNTATRS
ncbi:Fanconi anemia group M protein isoform X1 [Meleagris gallopavo]|uniref:FA complementation group M n=2 Tax=Meleagris gallopavo TaxID=9103 RepID=G1NM24_MELGA|nr:Fanconi anemia group M protein isoform X1 [Meleagris gallopavo]